MDETPADAASTSVSSVDGTLSSSGGSPSSSPPTVGGSGLIPPPPPPPPSVSLEKSYNDLEAWLSKLQQGTPLTEAEVKTLTELARERLLQESNVQPVPAPVTICGDIHVSWLRCVWNRIHASNAR